MAFFFHSYSLLWHRRGCVISLGLTFSTHSQYKWDGLKIHGTFAKFLKFQPRKVLCKRERQRQGLYKKDDGCRHPVMMALLSYCQSSCAAVVFLFLTCLLGNLIFWNLDHSWGFGSRNLPTLVSKKSSRFPNITKHDIKKSRLMTKVLDHLGEEFFFFSPPLGFLYLPA